MLRSVLRCQALVRPNSARTLTRFTRPALVAVRASPRTFSSSPASRDSGNEGGYSSSSIESELGRSYRKSDLRREPSKIIWIGNVPFTAVKADIENLFHEFGTITSVRIGTFASGQPRGFAHIEFSDIASTQRVLEAHEENQFFLDGRVLNLDYASPAASRNVPPPSTSLYFGSFYGDEDLLRDALKEFKDAIVRIKIMAGAENRGSTNFGFIECATIEDATAILNKFNGTEVVPGQPLQLSYARRRNEAPRFTSYNTRESGRGQYGSRGQDRREFSRSNDGEGQRGGNDRY